MIPEARYVPAAFCTRSFFVLSSRLCGIGTAATLAGGKVMNSDAGGPGSDPTPDVRLSGACEPGILTIAVKPDRDRVLVCPAGEVDLATAGKLEGQILELLEAGFDHVVVDLRAVTFIDSTGIRALFTTHSHAQATGRSVSLILGGRATRLPLEIAGIIDILEIEPGSGASADGSLPG